MFSLYTYRENCPAHWQPCFFTDLDHFLVRDINETNVLTKFHDDWAQIVTSRVFTRNTVPPLAAILGIKCDFYRIIGTNVLTKFDEDRTKNVASRVFTRQNVDDERRTTDDRLKAITKAHHENVVLR
ncbi:hypothetical protein DPMN_091302 [Dreissena polymorpha]|uniref:Uncharacterized protein n=1 Tax=Dreissena polymorpha TaxID=45954 RepID=A0A9D4KZA8_DREPO|nr:hypothetical protein DPMN_091302 [Dreissena polymorpha]